MSTRDGVAFEVRCRIESLPIPVREFRFHATRRWRFDYAWPEYRVALEVEGGMFAQGHHVRPRGIRRDLAKYNAAAVDGWIVLRCVPETLGAPSTLAFLQQAFDYRAGMQLLLSTSTLHRGPYATP